MAFIEAPRFPVDIKYGSLSGPTSSTDIVVTGGGVEHRNANWGEPLYRFNAKYMVKTRTTALQIYDLHLACKGRFGSFRYQDAWDFTSASDGVSAPSTSDQTLGTGNASVVDFQLIKEYVVSNEITTRIINKPVVIKGVLIELQGVPQTETTDYTVNYTTGVVTMIIAPPIGHIVKGGFEFDVPVRFDTDDLSDLSFAISTADGAGDIVNYPDIPLVEVRV